MQGAPQHISDSAQLAETCTCKQQPDASCRSPCQSCLCRAGAARGEAAPQNISLLHVHGDPLRFLDLSEKVDVKRFACAIVLCDAAWADPDLDNANGIALRTKVGQPPASAALLYLRLYKYSTGVHNWELLPAC